MVCRCTLYVANRAARCNNYTYERYMVYRGTERSRALQQLSSGTYMQCGKGYRPVVVYQVPSRGLGRGLGRGLAPPRLNNV